MSMRVLKLKRPEGDQRTGVFTSGIVSTGVGWKIALFFTGCQHAGENLTEVVRQRAGVARHHGPVRSRVRAAHGAAGSYRRL
jgi:hypothetical protein